MKIWYDIQIFKTELLRSGYVPEKYDLVSRTRYSLAHTECGLRTSARTTIQHSINVLAVWAFKVLPLFLHSSRGYALKSKGLKLGQSLMLNEWMNEWMNDVFINVW